MLEEKKKGEGMECGIQVCISTKEFRDAKRARERYPQPLQYTAHRRVAYIV
jgi:hypothetical protein